MSVLRTISTVQNKLYYCQNLQNRLEQFVGPYAPWEGAWARKPFPGMLEAGRQLIDNATLDSNQSELELLFGDDWVDRPDDSSSFMVGDRQVDIIAATRYGIKSYLCNPDEGLSGVMEDIF